MEVPTTCSRCEGVFSIEEVRKIVTSSAGDKLAFCTECYEYWQGEQSTCEDSHDEETIAVANAEESQPSAPTEIALPVPEDILVGIYQQLRMANKIAAYAMPRLVSMGGDGDTYTERCEIITELEALDND